MKMIILYLHVLLVFPLMALSRTASNQVIDYKNDGYYPKKGQTQAPKGSLVITDIDPIATGANFCKELNYIIKAIETDEFGKLIDRNKSLGASEFEARVSLSGFTDLSGQDMLGYMAFNGTLANSETTASNKAYQELVSQIESCISSSFTKKTDGKTTQFTNKKNDTFWIDVQFSESVDLKYITISIQKTYD